MSWSRREITPTRRVGGYSVQSCITWWIKPLWEARKSRTLGVKCEMSAPATPSTRSQVSDEVGKTLEEFNISLTRTGWSFTGNTVPLAHSEKTSMGTDKYIERLVDFMEAALDADASSEKRFCVVVVDDAVSLVFKRHGKPVCGTTALNMADSRKLLMALMGMRRRSLSEHNMAFLCVNTI